MPTTLFEKPAVLKSLPRDRHAVIEASAGTGKTFTIEHLVADIVVSTPCDIDNVLVVTFTERATAELRARVRGLLRRIAAEDHRARLEEEGRTDDAWEITDEIREKLVKAIARFDSAPIATIHGFCQRVLVEHAFLNRQLFETRRVDRRTLFGASFRHVLRREIGVVPELRDLLLRWLEQSTVGRLEELLAAGHEHRAPIEATLHENASLAARIVHAFLPRVAAHLDAEKRIRGVFDYDDLITGMRDTLVGPNGEMLASALREQFKFALIDEFQDTDEVQWTIFKKLFVERAPGQDERVSERSAGGADGEVSLADQPCTLFVIGDPKQAIYAFRGADIYTYLAAAAELRERGATLLTLGDNFRSSGPLIDAYNRILEPGAKDAFFSGSVRYDVAVRCARQDLVAEGPSGHEAPVHLIGLPALSAGEKYKSATLNAAFGRFIVDEIVALLHAEPAPLRFGSAERRRVKPDDIFVLTHKNADAESIAALLSEAGVPAGLARSGGLFEEPEAADVRDVLAAVVDPLSRSNRLKAWATPFFGVPWERLGDCAELPPDHPLFERLLAWKALADQRRYDRLFQAMLDDGLVERELFFSDPDRSLALYRRIIDALLEETAKTHYAPHELLARLHALVTGRAVAEEDEIESGPPRGGVGQVSVMTIHKSKGLEAPVVFVHGGFYARHLAGPVVVLHDKGRRVHLGELSKAEKEVYDRERREELERLLYVALTRAKVRLYLPVVDRPATGLSGPHKLLNGRLEKIRLARAKEPALPALFVDRMTALPVLADDIVKIPSAPRSLPPPSGPTSTPVSAPASALLPIEPVAPPDLDRLKAEHRALMVTSYTALKKLEGEYEPPVELAAVVRDPANPPLLPGGKLMGIFLHDILENLDLDTLEGATNAERWAGRDDVEPVFLDAARRYGFDRKTVDACKPVIFRTLTQRVHLHAGRTVDGLWRCSCVREMELLFPIPERDHPLLSFTAASEGRRWTVDRGLLKGYVDLVFEHDGLVYFADWKSDSLADFGPEHLEHHVRKSYGLQAAIYSLGISRVLGVRTEEEYEARFGGLLYVFLRGMGSDNDNQGMYFARPTWRDLLGYEEQLRTTAFWGGHDA